MHTTLVEEVLISPMTSHEESIGHTFMYLHFASIVSWRE